MTTGPKRTAPTSVTSRAPPPSEITTRSEDRTTVSPSSVDLVATGASVDLSTGPHDVVTAMLDALSGALPGWSFEVTRLSGDVVAATRGVRRDVATLSGAVALGGIGVLSYTASTPGLPSDLDESTLRTASSLITVLLAQADRTTEDARLREAGRAAATYAHDLVAPLMAVTVYARALGERGELREADELVTKLVSAATRAERMSRSFLAFLRRPARTRTAVSLQDVADEALRAIELAAHQAHARLEVTVADGLRELLANPDDLVALIVNLLTNAVQALPPSGGLVRLQVRDEGGDVALVVGDSGHGLPEEVAPHIFEPFFSTKSPDKGSGLGLAIVRRVVEQHGGTISVRRSPLGGAEFDVRLPRDHG